MYKLRELERKDLEQINKWRNDPELIELLGAPYRFINLEVDTKWYENYMGNRNSAIRCAIIQEGSDDILGLVSLVSINYMNQSAEFHIMIGDKENQGKGIGTFAVNAMLDHAFNNMNLRRIELSVLDSNERAKALYKKCGFVYEGTKREAKYKKGKFEDLLYYSILRDEYRKISGGGRSQNNISCYTIEIAECKDEINKILEECDHAYEQSVVKREYYLELLEKFDRYAVTAYAYNGTVLGYIVFYSNNPEYSYVSLIAVNPENQNEYIGKKLLKYCEDITRENKINTIRLEVRKNNSTAIRFYSANGYELIDNKDDKSFYMEKTINY